jgi:hypothetical protein
LPIIAPIEQKNNILIAKQYGHLSSIMRQPNKNSKNLYASSAGAFAKLLNNFPNKRVQYVVIFMAVILGKSAKFNSKRINARS